MNDSKFLKTFILLKKFCIRIFEKNYIGLPIFGFFKERLVFEKLLNNLLHPYMSTPKYMFDVNFVKIGSVV